MISPVQSFPQSTLRQACELFVRHRFPALPVVDENHILGVVDVTVFSQGRSLSSNQQVENLFQLIVCI
jgi:CBS-domain-containing membrane protein